MGGTRVHEAQVSVEDVDGAEAADALIDEALENGVSDPDFAFLFCSPKFDIDALVVRAADRLAEFDAELIGGTTSGEISTDGSFFGTAVLLLIETDNMAFHTGLSDDLHDDPEASGEQAVQAAIPDGFGHKWGYQAVFTIMSGLSATQPGVEFKVLKGMSRHIGTDVPVVGGSSGDDMNLETNYQFLNGDVYDDAVAVVAIDSSLPLRVGQAHGMNTKIASGVITGVDGKVITEINGEPAAQFYADAIGTTVDDLRDTFEAPSGIELHNVFRYALEKTLADEITPGNLRLFTPVAVTDDGGLDITVELPENHPIHVVEGNDEDIISAAKDAFSHIDTASEEPLFAVLSDCTCRNTGMGQEAAQQEIEQLVDHLGCDVIGMYGYGEIGGTDEEFCTFKNQTVSGFVVTRPR